MSEVLIERRDGWAEVILNRPDRRNAIDGPLAEALRAALAELNADEATRVILLRGAGGAFCSGLDVKAFNTDPPPAWAGSFRATWDEVHCLLIESPKVIIGALEKYAINGGAALAIACDLLVAGQGAFLQVGEIQIGMAAPKNIAWLVLRHGEAKAARLCLLGERVGAQALLDLEMATEIAADDAVVEKARALAVRIAGFPPQGVPRIKSALRAACGVEPRRWFEHAARHDRFAGTDRPSPRALQ